MALPAPIQNFVDGPRLPKIVLGVVGLVAFAAAGYFLLLAPAHERLAALRQKKAQVTADVNKIAELERRLALLQDRLPSEKETPTLYRALSSAAEQAGLGVSLFQPKEARPKDVVNEIPITVAAEGSYHQLAKFFERVAGLPRVVTITDFKMSSLPKSRNTMKADMTLATYMYRSSASPASSAGPARPAPPAPPKPAASLSRSAGEIS
jgi:type IV pilus assembly protein PilO